MGSQKPEQPAGTPAAGRPRKSLFVDRPSPAEFYGIQENQRELEPALDRLGIRRDPAMKTDSSERFITIPQDYPDVLDFETASEPPRIDFAIVQGTEPWYLPVDDQIHVPPLNASAGFAMWSGFGAVRRGPDGCFYYSIGNHMYYGGSAAMMRYDPVRKAQSVCFDLKEVLSWKPRTWTDGKIHGSPEIDADGNMVVTTFSGPRPLADDLNRIEYDGGHVIRYNIFSGRVEDLGVPLAGDTWCYSAYSGRHHLLFAVGQARNMVMAFDTKTRTMVYGGFPPPGIRWWMRCILIDPDTGRVYSSNTANRGKEMHFVSWERRNNTFTTLQAQSPVNPVTGQREPLRAHSHTSDTQGAYWCFDEFGFMFRFRPADELVEPVGINWGAEGKYTANLAVSPKGRYLYYLPGAHSRMYEYGTPLVQYDTMLKKKKVIAFLNDYFLDKYGYSPYGAYGIEIDAAGESVFFYTNGLFSTREMGSGYGRPAIFHVHIPASERIE
jgi:hypothetical protein